MFFKKTMKKIFREENYHNEISYPKQWTKNIYISKTSHVEEKGDGITIAKKIHTPSSRRHGLKPIAQLQVDDLGDRSENGGESFESEVEQKGKEKGRG